MKRHPTILSFFHGLAFFLIISAPGLLILDTARAQSPSIPVMELPLSDYRGSERSDGASWVSQRIFNIDFGPWIPKEEKSAQKDPAVVGLHNDFWNIVGVPWSNHHLVTRMRYASGDSSTIQVELKNLGGAWNSRGKMGMKSPMLNCYHYPMNNQGGNSEASLHRVYPGHYTLFLYGHGAYANYYGDYTVTVGEKKYGRKKTADTIEAVQSGKWVEGLQFVKFPKIEVASGESIRIVIQPGGEIVAPHGRRIRDAMICGLQLVPLE